jgi:hypothetical protein
LGGAAQAFAAPAPGAIAVEANLLRHATVIDYNALRKAFCRPFAGG